MRKIVILAALLLATYYPAFAQQPEWTRIHSEKFYFIADFPEQPKESNEDIETRFGKATSKRWTVELSGMFYEVSVSEFSDLPVTNSKSLNLFYDAICNDVVGKNCVGKGGDTQFDVVGRMSGARTQKGNVGVLMYLARHRFYLAKVIVSNSLEEKEQTYENVKKFLDSFLFLYLKDDPRLKEGEKKYTWGLPPSASQQLEKP